MRLVVYGAGAVGGVVGSLLHRAGHDLTLVARGPHLEAIRTAGLRLVTPHLDVVQAIPTVESAAEIEWTGAEVVLVAVKSQATAQIAPLLAAAAPPAVRVVSLQNGIANEPTLARWFERVYAVPVLAPTTHLEPGLVVAKSAGAPAILDVGRWPAGVDDTTTELVEAFGSAGMASEPRPEVMAWKHRKLLVNLGNVVDACCVPGEAADELERRLVAEGERTLAAAGLTAVSEAEDHARRGDLLRRGHLPGPTGSSTWQSLARGAGSLETDYLNGEIALLGRRHGVPTPLNARVQRLAAALEASGRPPRSADAGALLG